jgi:hypothetical protein
LTVSRKLRASSAAAKDATARLKAKAIIPQAPRNAVARIDRHS